MTDRYSPGPSAATKTATVRCGRKAKATGFLRTTASRACRTARRLAGFLAAKRPTDVACTEIYGGPQTASIRGTIGARSVNRTFDRANGCGITDWTRAAGLVPRASGGDPALG